MSSFRADSTQNLNQWLGIGLMQAKMQKGGHFSPPSCAEQGRKVLSRFLAVWHALGRA
jgi:hypothetical protein